jgi:uncharacterized LabA/DUF88 family protein
MSSSYGTEGRSSNVTSPTPAASSERVAAYVDGFNLYYGIRREGRRHLWLDLEKLAQSLLKPRQQLVAVRYFTARVRNDPPAEHRQQVYLNALTAHCGLVEIRQGRFQEKSRVCRSCRWSWTDYEEKESDVSLAVSLVEDAVIGLYDTALLVSADSDMCPAIHSVRRLQPSARVVAALPPNRNSAALRAICDGSLSIGMDKIRRSQLPDIVMAGTGTFARPDHWK